MTTLTAKKKEKKSIKIATTRREPESMKNPTK